MHRTVLATGKIRFVTEGTMQMHFAEQDLSAAAKHSQHINPAGKGHIASRTDDIEAFKALLQKNDIDFADYGTAFAKEWHQIFFTTQSAISSRCIRWLKRPIRIASRLKDRYQINHSVIKSENKTRNSRTQQSSKWPICILRSRDKREVTFADGLWKTLELYYVASNEFGTDADEVMWILSSELENLFPYQVTRSWSVVVITLRCRRSFWVKIVPMINYYCLNGDKP